jgi:flavin prenyltransferase
MSKRIIVAITGASGAVYAKGLLECLADAAIDTHLIVSPHGRELIANELGIEQPTPELLVGRERAGTITHHDYTDVGALPASGSFLTDAMVICPCSSNTLAEVAAGIASNLITRAAAVHLKERRRLVLVTREMPISQIELSNMLRVSQAGGIICPASPGYYLQPRTIHDLVDFVVGKLCDLLQVDHSLRIRWDPTLQRGARPAPP